ncbi:hypothetical protein GCM10007962_28950 [Yeosuana aromativorans]|uniref:Cytochrome c domain-containing protein n=1 Tax=Yeosuana aromativorans TaxID=288019 RepID=A0A8J3FIB4_9FLAO|nr:cytochrome c [Yeosuana aromativorans]GGK32862.1 hypothetical protein GCM10007962_28950 [Yeosuana aromativorans]
MRLFFLGLLFTFFSIFTAVSQTSPLQESIKRGSEIYTDFCMQCHLSTGLGQEDIYPPLAKSDYLMTNREASIRGIKFGQQGEMVVNGKTYNNIMSPLGLTDDEVADVMNYITNSWGNTNDKMVTIEEVSKIKK